jgi:hypothetical protein
MRTIIANCLPGLVKNSNLKFSSFFTRFCCVMALFLTINASAQTFPSATSCTSKDLTLVAASLPSAPCETCTPGDSIYKMLTVAINNKTGSTRTSFAFWATLVILNSNGDTASKTAISRCFSTIPKNATTSYQYGNLGFKCGQSLVLTDIWEAWTDASPGATCPVLIANTSTINPKCGTNPKINIVGGVDANIDVVDATCITTGSITVSPYGGSGQPYAITLYNGATKVDTASGIAANGSKTFSSLSAATYTIKLYDKNNCSIPVIRTRTLGSSSAPSVTGIGGAFTKTCSQNATGATIGETPVSGYSYSWSPSDGLSNANIGNPTANPSSTTTYTVTKTNTTTGCSNTKTVTVTVTTDQPSVTGIGGAFTKTCSQNATGATIGETPVNGYSYSWSPSTGLSAANIGNPTANPSSTTTYTVTKTDNATGCTNTKTVTVTVNKVLPAFTVSIVQPTLCNTGSLTITPCVAGSYHFSIGTASNTSGAFNNLKTGDVTSVQVSNDASGCASDPVSCSNLGNYSSCPQESPVTNRQSSTAINADVDQPTVKAYPNPFSDKIKFVINSPASGNGSLEVYNIMGQKVRTVYQGHVIAGDQSFELTIPKKQQATLVYIFRVGEKKVTGKLLQLNN